MLDPDDLISVEQKDLIETLLNSIEDAEVAVAVIDKMSGSFVSSMSIESASEKFARSLHDSWGVGDTKTQNGILIFLSIQDRAIFISRGDGMKTKFSDHILDVIIENMKPPLRNAEYGKAVEQCVTDVILVMQGKGSQVSYWSNFADYFNWILVAAFLSFFGYKSYSSWRYTSDLNRGQAAMKRLLDDMEKMSKDEFFDSATCPVCLEDFSENALENDSKKKIALRCGHLFCQQCVKELLKSSSTLCPICRNPIEKNTQAPAPRPPPRPADANRESDSENSGTSGGGCTANFQGSNTTVFHRHMPLLRYRFDRLRLRYPSYLDVATAREMSSILDNGGSVADMRRQFEARSAVVASIIAQQKKSGSSGASRSSFSGGRSGGGRSGRW